MDYLAINKNTNIREKSSSGGVFYSLAQYILNKNGIVFGAAWTADWQVQLQHITKMDQIPPLMGSKYIQADVANTYQECKTFLDQHIPVLYCGLPCQLHGLTKYLNQDYPNLFLVDIACHGLMPINIWQDYLATITRPDSKITSINFRKKEPSWENYSIEITYADNKKLIEHHNINKYMQAFLSDKYLKSSCYDCKFKNQFSKSDLIIGDAWGTTTKFNNNLGVSFIKASTEKGQTLLSSLTDLELIPTNYNKENQNGCLKNKILTPKVAYNKNIFTKKVAILTLHLFDNLGGILQAYALNKLISDFGYNAETLTWKDERLLNFVPQYIPIRIFNNSQDLKNIKETDYDIFVVGSDQIWRKIFLTDDFKTDYLNIPFLKFTNNWNKTRIAYAASFGVAENTWEYNSTEIEQIKGILNQFNTISVREVQSINDCKNRLDLQVVNCLDPVLLLMPQEYLKLCQNIPKSQKDVFVYLLDPTVKKEQTIKTFCDAQNLTYLFGAKTIEEWLAAFRDAKYIITDSFHGCILSILFNKPFICLYNKWRGNARFDSLIKLFNIQNNFIFNIEQLKDTPFQLNIDQNILKELRTSSLNYLQNSLALPPQKMQLKSVNLSSKNKKKGKNIDNFTYLYF